MPKRLLKAVCCSAALLGSGAQTDDMQVLIQHSAAPHVGKHELQHNEPKGSGPRPEEAATAPLCTEKDLEDYDKMVDSIEQLQTKEEQRVQAELDASTPPASSESPASVPVYTWKVLQEVIIQMAKKTLSVAALDFLPAMIPTDDQKIPPEPQVNEDGMTKDMVKFEQDVSEIALNPVNWAKAIRESLDVLDQDIETKLNTSLAKLVAKIPSLRSTKPTGKSAKEIGTYLLRKVLPVSFLEVNEDPRIQNAVVEFASKLPENDAHMRLFLVDEVMPVVHKAMPELLQWHGNMPELRQLSASIPFLADSMPFPILAHKFEAVSPPSEEVSSVTHTKYGIPRRKCQTCNERYSRETYGPDSSQLFSCSAHCNLVLFSCFTGFTGDCVMKLGSCLKCHSGSMGRLDECTGLQANTVAIAKFNRTVDIIKKANLSMEHKLDWVNESLADTVFASMLF